MTKREFIEFVRQSIMAGDITADKNKGVHPLRLQYIIASGFNEIYYATFSKNPHELDFYAKNYEADILYDTARNTYYSTLPKPVVQFPNGEGIRKIGTLQGNKVEFVKTNINEADYVNGTILDLIDTKIGYLQTSNRVEYRRFDPYLAIKKVYISMVVPFNDLSMDEWVQIPSGKDVELINVVKQIIMQRLPEDKQNDNA